MHRLCRRGPPSRGSPCVTAVVVELPLLVILVMGVSTMSRRTARMTQRLRGMGGDSLPLWRQPLVMTPPERAGV